MDAKRAAEVLRELEAFYRAGAVCLESTAGAVGMGAQALEALHWWFDEDNEPQREAVRLQREEADVRWTSDQWIAAVLNAMQKEGKA